MFYGKYEVIKVLDYGWSDDQKYLIQDYSGNKYLLRRSPESKKQHAQDEFGLVQRLRNMGLNIHEPSEMIPQQDNERIYRWIDGNMLQDVIIELSPKHQYELGMHAGITLRAIHSLKLEAEEMEWASYYRERVIKKIENYRQCGNKLEQDDILIQWICSYEHVLDSRPITHQHGDYHPGNMVLTSNCDLFIIDFDRHSIGDPWEEFNRIAWSAKISPLFASGQIDGYFTDEIPEDFFKLLKYYLAVNALGSIPWAIKFGETEINVMIEQAQLILNWYPDEDQIIPNWYVSGVDAIKIR